MKVLLDQCVLVEGHVVESATEKKVIQWGDLNVSAVVSGFRKKTHDDHEYQEQIDALFTIGRLIRERKVIGFTYDELDFERIRGPGQEPEFNAFSGCTIERCSSPIERSKFFNTENLAEYVSKGGKNDLKKGAPQTSFSQIAFIDWLLKLSNSDVDTAVKWAEEIGLTIFELESFKRIDWFRFICERFGSRENFPDAFHLWAAERNRIDVFLTLEKKLPNIVQQIERNKNASFTICTKVLRPLEFLKFIGVTELDHVPVKPDRFYTAS
jgi:hypothetical protein